MTRLTLFVSILCLGAGIGVGGLVSSGTEDSTVGASASSPPRPHAREPANLGAQVAPDHTEHPQGDDTRLQYQYNTSSETLFHAWTHGALERSRAGSSSQ